MTEIKKIRLVKETDKSSPYPIITDLTSIPDILPRLSAISTATGINSNTIMTLTGKVIYDQESVATKMTELRDIASAGVVDSTAILRLARDIDEIINRSRNDLIGVLTALFSQDITGQELKKITAQVDDLEKKILQ